MPLPIGPLAAALLSAALLAAAPAAARAADPVTVGLILPMTGPFASTGKQIAAAAKLYVAQHGEAGGRPVSLVVRDDAGVPDTTRRLAQELVVNDHAAVIAGFGLTPLALAAAPVATRAQVPEVVMAAANGIHSVVTVVSDYGPGLDAEKWFAKEFTAKGGHVDQALHVPLQNPDFAPFLQRAADARPNALFVFVPSGVGAAFIRQFVERGLDKSGIKLICTGDVVDDDILNGMGPATLGVVSGQHYSAAHDSALNHAFVAAFQAANPGVRPNFMAVGGYDGMALIYKALDRTHGDSAGPALLAAMKGQSWDSPRGPVTIDAATRDIVQNVYMRRVEKRDGQLWNIEFATIPMVRDPAAPAQ